MLNLHEDGSFTYTPVFGYSGPDSFSYNAFDGTSFSSLATVDITVTVNHDPVILSGTDFTVAEGQTFVATLDAFDPDGDPLLYELFGVDSAFSKSTR